MKRKQCADEKRSFYKEHELGSEACRKRGADASADSMLDRIKTTTFMGTDHDAVKAAGVCGEPTRHS